MEHVGGFIRADNIKDAWYKGLNLIWDNGIIIKGEGGGEVKELLNVVVVIQNPNVVFMPSEVNLSTGYLDEYSKQLIFGDGDDNFAYTYGQRLRNWNNQVDQILHVIEKLKADSSTRRATACTWFPLSDTMVDEVPCMVVVDFKIRGGKLHLTTVFRSHDFADAYPANLYGLSKLLEYVAEKVSVPSGTITTVSISAHVYEYRWNNIEKIVFDNR